MRAFLIGLLCLGVYTVPARYYYVCEYRDDCKDTEQVANNAANENDNAELPPRPTDLGLKDADGNDILKGYDHFACYKGKSDPVLSANNEEYLKGVAKYLTDNPDDRLAVTGYYYADEKSDDDLIDNMGIARANKIIDKLVAMGFDRGRFKPDSKQLEDEDILNRPVSFDVLVTDMADKGGEELVEATYTFTRMTFSDVNFDKGSAKLNPTVQFSNYIDSVKTYLSKNPNKKVTVFGHTDSDGSDEFNMGLGMRRSATVRGYMIDKGIDGKSIKNESEGEKKPIAPNDNEENMRKNRRVEIVIK